MNPIKQQLTAFWINQKLLRAAEIRWKCVSVIFLLFSHVSHARRRVSIHNLNMSGHSHLQTDTDRSTNHMHIMKMKLQFGVRECVNGNVVESSSHKQTSVRTRGDGKWRREEMGCATNWKRWRNRAGIKGEKLTRQQREDGRRDRNVKDDRESESIWTLDFPGVGPWLWNWVNMSERRMMQPAAWRFLNVLCQLS